MENWIIIQALNHYIPREYMPIIVTVLSFLVAFEQWLASTNRIKANSTLQLIVSFIQYFIGKEKGNGTITGPATGSQGQGGVGAAGEQVSTGSGPGIDGSTPYQPNPRDVR